MLEFVKPATLDAALGALSDPGACVLCGGTDLMVKLRSGAVSCEMLVDVSDLAELHELCLTSDGVVIGAATSEAEILGSEAICARLPLLERALRSLGSSQIRNRGTLGGNLVNASPAADGVLALLAYGASVQLISADGVRSLLVEQFLEGPGRTGLCRGELVQSIRVGADTAPEATHVFFHKVGRRKAMTIAVASLGGWAVVEDGTIRAIGMAVGSVAPTPLRLRSVEQRLVGRPIGRDMTNDAQAMVADQVSPIDDVRGSGGYRRQVVAELAARFLEELGDGDG